MSCTFLEQKVAHSYVEYIPLPGLLQAQGAPFAYKLSAYSSSPSQLIHVSWTPRHSSYHCRNILFCVLMSETTSLAVLFNHNTNFCILLTYSQTYIYIYFPSILSPIQNDSIEYNYFHALKVGVPLQWLIYRYSMKWRVYKSKRGNVARKKEWLLLFHRGM